MPVLQKNPSYLTYGEAKRRFAENPNDPELEEYRESLEKIQNISKTAALGLIPRFDGLKVVLESAFSASNLLKQFTFPKSSLFEAIESLNKSAIFFPRISPLLTGLQAPHFASALQSLNPGATIAKQIVDSQSGIFTELQKRIDSSFETPQITYLPPSPEMRQAQLIREIRELRSIVEGQTVNEDGEVIGGVDLLTLIPVGDKYVVPRRIAEKFKGKLRVNNFEIAKCISPTVMSNSHKRRKLSQSDYLYKKQTYTQKIKNALRYLRKVAEQEGYTFKFHTAFTELVEKSN